MFLINFTFNLRVSSFMITIQVCKFRQTLKIVEYNIS
jgi:hypothetical protein